MSDNSSPTIQDLQNSSQSQTPPSPNRLKSVWKRLKWLWSLGGITAVVVAVLLIPQYNDMVVTVLPISLPASIKSTDGSTTVFTDEMIGVAQNILNLRGGLTPQTEQIEKDCFEANTLVRELRRVLIEEFSYEVRIIKQRDRSPYEIMADHLARSTEGFLPFFKRRSVEINGEVIDKGNQLNLVLTATYPEGRVYKSSIISGPSRELLVKRAGKELLRFAAPWLYASTAAFGDTRDGRQTLDILSNEFSLSDQSLILAMKGFTFLYSKQLSDPIQNQESANKSFTDALAINPGSYWALIGNGWVNLNLFSKGGAGTKSALQWSHFQTAEEFFKKAIEREPSNSEAYGFLYALYKLKGDTQAAATQRALLITHARKRQQHFQAVEALISLNALSDRPDSLNEAAAELALLNDEPGDKDHFEQTSLLRSRGLVAAKRGNLLELEQVFAEASRRRDTCLLVDLAKFALSTSEEQTETKSRETWVKRSIEYHQRAAESGAKGFHFYNNWGLANGAIGAHDQAIEKYKKSLDFYGDETWALSNWGNVLLRQQKYEAAEQKFMEAMAFGKTQASVEGLLKARLSRSLQLTNQSMRNEALTNLLLVFAKEEIDWPKLAPGIYAVASYAHCQLRHKDQAIAYRSKIIGLSPRDESLIFLELDNCINGLQPDTLRQSKIG